MSQQDTRTLYELIRSAYAARQNSNLQDVLLHFAADVARLRTILETSAATAGDREVSDASLYRHPICVLYSARLCQLTGSEVGLRLTRAMEWCEHMLQQELLRQPPTPLPQDAN